jgi:hypothetical protein
MRILLVCASALLAGCGYVGDPLPPALNIPEKVADLRAIQRGDHILIDFTAPALTTEALAIREFSGVDVRIGPIPPQFSMESWSAAAKAFELKAEPGTPVHAEVFASEWTGREVLVAVRLAGSRGRVSDWSNAVTLKVREALTVPANVKAEPHPNGVRLSWAAPPSGVSVRVRRQAEGEKEPAVLATVGSREYIDATAATGKPYSYTVQAVADSAESETSAPVTIVPSDVFPPAAPASVTAVAGIGSIELAWERNTETDLRGYRVYRANAAGEFTVVGELVDAPAYSDRQVSAGTTYRYQIAALDQSGNESPRSPVVEVTAP